MSLQLCALSVPPLLAELVRAPPKRCGIDTFGRRKLTVAQIRPLLQNNEASRCRLQRARATWPAQAGLFASVLPLGPSAGLVAESSQEHA